MPFPEFRDELLAMYRASRAPKTAQKMAQVLKMAGALPGVATTADLTPTAVAAFATIAAEGRHPNTAATLISFLRRACSYAEGRGALAMNPFTLWPGWVRFIPGRGPSVHSPTTIGRVLADMRSLSGSAEGGRLHAWACLLAHTGLRRDEALYLRDEDLDRDAGTLEVRRRLKRPTTRRRLPITPALEEVLADWLPRRPIGWLFPNSRGNPWSGGSPGYRPIDRLRQAGARSGVPGLTPGSLRHSFATAAATEWAVPPATLQKWMGHTDLRTTLRYYVHLEDRHLREASARIRFDGGAKAPA